MDAFEKLFQPETMAARVRRFADQTDERSFIQVYQAGEKLEPIADAVTWNETRFSRDLAPLTGRDSPSESAKKTTKIPRSGTLLDIKEHADLPAPWLYFMKGEGGLPDPEGALGLELQNLTNRAMKTANFIAARSFLTKTGAVDLATVPNSKLTGTITWPVQSIDAAATWATDTTKIRSSEINAMKKTYKRVSGMRPGVAIASPNIEKYIAQNVEVTKFITEGSLAARMLQSSFQDGGGVAQFGGLEWNFVDDVYADDDTPDTVAAVSADEDIFVVLPRRELWREAFAFAEGRMFVPSGVVASGVAGATGMMKEVRGFGAYVELMTNPIGLRLHVLMRFQLIQKIQKAACAFDSTP